MAPLAKKVPDPCYKLWKIFLTKLAFDLGQHKVLLNPVCCYFKLPTRSVVFCKFPSKCALLEGRTLQLFQDRSTSKP